MNLERKQKLISYLYPTVEIMDFMCNDVYQELKEVIPLQCCISYKNNVSIVRTENLKFVKQKINTLIENDVYKKILFELYKSNNLNKISNDVLIGFVFYVSNIKRRYNNIDIFRDKKSICYERISLLDFI